MKLILTILSMLGCLLLFKICALIYGDINLAQQQVFKITIGPIVFGILIMAVYYIWGSITSAISLLIIGMVGLFFHITNTLDYSYLRTGGIVGALGLINLIVLLTSKHGVDANHTE